VRVSLKWLREFIEIKEPVHELADRLDLTGTKVEAVHEIGAALDGIVVGRIEKIEPHPNADTLRLCEVNVGEKTTPIVCGAPNIEEGQTVPVALVGATLPGGMTVRKAKIRGIESEGMLASEAELGLGEDHSGIMILDGGLEPGRPLVEALDLLDTVLELEITPNRPDCLSMIGVAREIGAIMARSYRRPEAVVGEVKAKTADAAGVRIEDPDLCPRYCARVITGVTIGPSPRWMQERLMAGGIRPISNVVDVTNYVMLETGQPLHAFDYDTIAQHRIIVRRAGSGETLETLDGVERRLSEDMLLIADPSGPIALAGVMGGGATEVSGSTTNVLLEGANFLPASISRTSRNLGLLSEASMRFERGADVDGLYYSLDRAAQLMVETGGGEALAGIIDEYPRKIEPQPIVLRAAHTGRVLGTELERDYIAELLRRLEVEVRTVGADALEAVAPTFRPDLEREIDLIEEIARLHGFNEVPSTLPSNEQPDRGLTQEQKLERVMRRSLETSGVFESMTYTFVDPRQLELLRIPFSEDKLVWVENPLSAEQAALRPSLLPGLVGSLIGNVNRGIGSVALYEVGRVFEATGEHLPLETKRLGIVMTGDSSDVSWYERPRRIDFFDVKGSVESLLDALTVREASMEPASHPSFHPGRCASILVGGLTVGVLGELHPRIQHAIGLPSVAAVAEIDVEPLLAASHPVQAFAEVSRHPAVQVDLALVVDETVPSASVSRLIDQTAGALLESLALFDVYRGEQVAQGKKSLAFQLVFRAPDRTLTEEEVEKARARVVGRLAREVGAQVRA